MSPKSFLYGLMITVLGQAILLLPLIWAVPDIQAHVGFITVSIITMSLFCLLLYAGAKILARSRMTRLFIQLIMIAVFLKMLVCLALIIGYKKLSDPPDTAFFWPFLIIYITTTIFEVIFMERVGHEKPPVAK